MKPMNLGETRSLVQELQSMVGARFQEVSSNETSLGLGFYSRGEMVWLWLDLKPSCPLALLINDKPPPHKKKVKPISLFINAHISNRILHRVDHLDQFGRVFRLIFAPEDYIEIRLFPHGENAVVSANEKKISWNKVDELVSAPETEETEGRSLSEILRQWEDEQKSKPSKAGASNERAVEKKRNAVVTLRADIEEKKQMPWRKIGEWLKAEQSMDVPSEWNEFVDRSLGLAGNIEHCFEKARGIEIKIATAEKRLTVLEAAITHPVVEKPNLPPQKKGAPQVQTRKRELQSGLTAWIGKSAEDNLNLLREAQSWDYWIHLRDFPGAHAIIRRGRKQVVSDRDLIDVGRWCATQSGQSRKALKEGDPVEIVVAECRFVRPIKGDRVGRVNYSNERVLRFRL